ncbi:MAG: septal ring lytic transglycosylase RlpA family protein [Thermodesulfobacteriota bacterium]
MPRALSLLALALVLILAAGCGRKVLETPAPRPAPRPEPAPAPAAEPQRTAPKGTFKPYAIAGTTYYPLAAVEGGWEEEGLASWYGPGFHGQKTSCGETYDMNSMTAAHKVLPMHTRIRVQNLENGRSADLRVNDRGPFVAGRIVDLSHAGAQALGVVGPGTARVRLTVLGGEGMSPEAVVAAVARETFYVQVGAFTVSANAERLARELRSGGYPSTRIQEAVVDGVRYWRVQAGAFAGVAHANEGLSGLADRFPGSFILAD